MHKLILYRVRDISVVFLFMLSAISGTGQAFNINIDHPCFKREVDNPYNDFLYQDSYGYLWISSSNGLFRTNGRDMKKYYPNEKKTSIIHENIQSDFFEDSKGNIWVASLKGLNKYVREKDIFEHHQVQDSTGNFITDNYTIIHLEAEDLLWVKAGNIIYRYDANKRISDKMISTNGKRFGILTNENNQLTDIFACPWKVANGFEYFRISGNKIVHSIKNWNNGLSEIEVRDCLVQDTNRVWLFTNKGMLEFNPQAPEKIKSTEIKQAVTDGIFIDTSSHHLIALDEELYLFDTQSRRTKEEQLCKKIKNPYIVFKDRKGLLWTRPNDNNIILSHQLNPNKFKNLFLSNENLPLSKTASLAADKEQQIWILSLQEGIFIFDKKNKFQTQIPFFADFQTGAYFYPKQLSVDTDGTIWASGDKQIHKIKQYKPILKYADENGPNIFQLLHLSPEQKLFTSGNGLYLFNLKHNTPVLIKEMQDDIFQIFKMPSGKVYLPSGSGLHVFKDTDLLQGKYAPIATIPINANILSIHESQQHLWLGTSSGLMACPLSLSVHQDSIINIFGNLLAFKNLQVTGINEAPDKSLWLTTNEGLLHYFSNNKFPKQFNPITDSMFCYRKEDGMTDDLFSLFATTQTDNGEILIGTNKGPISFHPDSIKAYPYTPQIEITSLAVNNEPYETDKNINLTTSLQLNYNENNLIIGVNPITHYLPQFSKIYYRLKGYEENFYLLDGKTIRYQQLPYENFTLEIHTENANGKKGTMRSISINIQPPWWTLWWVILLGILATLLISFIVAYAIYRYNLDKNLKSQQLIYESKNQERNRIAGELHDDLGSGLSVIKLLSDDTIQSPNIERIHESAEDLLEKMSDIVWAMNAENDTLESLVGSLYLHVYDYLDLNKLGQEIDIASNLPEKELSGEKRRNILLVVKEILHNIVKHARASKVSFKLAVEDDILKISIKDDGVGFDPAIKKHNSNGLTNIRERIHVIKGNVAIDGSDGGRFDIAVPLFSQQQKQSGMKRFFERVLRNEDN